MEEHMNDIEYQRNIERAGEAAYYAVTNAGGSVSEGYAASRRAIREMYDAAPEHLRGKLAYSGAPINDWGHRVRG
jgi:hypothetical protein